MDDPELEWEIQESSTGDSENGKLSWLMRLGKKIFVTGIVISSAPLLFPPIMAISAIGFVCSVPYGVLLVSYLCTKTLMSRLLPMPSRSAPLLLEYGKACNGEEEEVEEETNGVQNEVLKGDISIEREEEELKEDIIEEIEARIEFVDKRNEEPDKGDILQKGAYQKDGVQNDLEGSAGDDSEFMNERPSLSFEVKEITGMQTEQPMIGECRNKPPAEKGQGIEAVVQRDEKCSSNLVNETLLGSGNVKEKDEYVQSIRAIDALVNEKLRGTTGEQQKEKEFQGINEVKEEEYVRDKQPIDEACNVVIEFVEDEKNGNNKENETQFLMEKVDVHFTQSTDIEEDEELVRETRGLLEKIRDQGERGYMDDKPSTEKVHVDTEKDYKQILQISANAVADYGMEMPASESETEVEKNKADSKEQMKGSVEKDIQKREQPVGPVSETANDDSITKGLTVEIATPIVGQAKDENIVDPSYRLNKEKKDVVFSNEDEREINDEQGLDLSENLSTVSLQGSPPEVNTEESWPSSSYSLHQDASDSSDLPVSTKAQEADNTNIPVENARDAPSNEVRPKIIYVACHETIT
ncbi:nestin-like [Gossypium australe]|uniref:Nestin-like n=1 Tax=Gossypium australe TaxID=47621 RepID=A0A5B6X3B2_9ROSI|nr:nestin-like [Gossypium australe]